MARGRRSKGVLVLALCAGAVLWWLDHRGVIEAERGEYRELHGCTLVAHRNNDGDSFRVKTPDGKTQEFRLYFVDAPESALKTYRNGDSNKERLRHQGEYFGKLTQKETIAVGKQAKELTARLLGSEPFSVFTSDEPVFGGPRHYAFVQVRHRGQIRWLHELLVENGLARIYTKGARMPDGTEPATRKRDLFTLEHKAKRGKRGAWERGDSLSLSSDCSDCGLGMDGYALPRAGETDYSLS